jgi:lipoprotein signal peptidase
MTRLRLLYAAPTAVVFLAVDQTAKLLVRTGLPICHQYPIVSCVPARIGPIPLVRMQNSGTGYLALRDPALAAGLGLLGCLLIVAYAAWLRRVTWMAVLGVGLQLAGALSNLLDRVVAGEVTDYINVSPTFTFNLADLFLLVGMVLAVAGIARALASPAGVEIGAWP